jgi:TolB protein
VALGALAWSCSSAASVEGGTIAFARSTRGGHAFFGASDIYLIRPDGTGLRRVTHTRRPNEQDIDPAWSPDGRRIVFTRQAVDQTRISGRGTSLWVVNADGTGERRLVAHAVSADWSPDGSRIAYAGNGITVSDADGGNAHKIVRRGGMPDWSPDGRRIAFEALVHGHLELHVVDANGGNEHMIYPHRGYEPDWSPDSAQILFYRDGSAFLVNADGSNFHVINGDYLEAYDTSWSPVGDQILFAARAKNDYFDLWTMNADGTQPHKLTRYRLDDLGPAWSATESS